MVPKLKPRLLLKCRHFGDVKFSTNDIEVKIHQTVEEKAPQTKEPLNYNSECICLSPAVYYVTAAQPAALRL